MGHTLLRGVFLILGDFRATGTASVEFQRQHATDVEAVIPSIHFLESTKSKRWVLTQVSLRHVPFRHSDLLTLRQQRGVGRQGSRYEVRFSDSLLKVKKITRR